MKVSIDKHQSKNTLYNSPFDKVTAVERGLRGIFLHFLFPIIFCFTLTITVSAQNFKPDTLTLPLNIEYATAAELSGDTFLDYFFYGTNSAGNIGYWIYENQGNQTFTLRQLSLPTITEATFAFADLNRDNLLDVVISGRDSVDDRTTNVFYSLTDPGTGLRMQVDSLQASIITCADFDNDGRRDLMLNGTKADSLVALVYQNVDTAFIVQDTLLIALQAGVATAYDWNNDDEIDLLLSGTTENGEAVTQLYQNQTNFAFAPKNVVPDSVIGTAVAIGDYNHDGRNDILLSGQNAQNEPATTLYQYTNQNYELLKLEMPSIRGDFASLADYNHDGLADISLAGQDASGQNVLRWYFNQDSTVREEVYDLLLLASDFYQTVGDMNNDGNLDGLIVANYPNSPDSLFLLWNETNTENAGPGRPSAPEVRTIANKTFLNWQASPDDTTQLAALTFDLYVQQEGNVVYDVSPEFSDEFKHRADYGRAGYGTEHIVRNLPEGTFHWGVAAVDNSFRMSEPCEGGGGREVCFTITREDTAVCVNTTLRLGARQAVDWYSTQQGYLQTSRQLDYTVVKSDTLYYAIQSETNCAINYTITVTTDEEFDLLPSDTTVCRNEPLVLVTDSVFSAVNWHSARQGLVGSEDTLAFEVIEPDTLWLEATLPSACLVYDTMIIDLFPEEELIADTQVSVESGSLVTLRAEEALGYTWFPADNLSDTTQQSVTASPTQTTTYFLQAVTLNGCSVTDSITVILEPARVLTTLFVPNLFSPNGDGKNDEFRLYGQRVETLTFQVYDRQGTLLFETNRLAEGWDGKYRNQSLPNGLYLWKISGSFEDGTPLVFEGNQSGTLRLVR
ncbi:FG-GAP-like repeat-containing protein [Tunicatimonas pelagia]|uniref:FG-GAP-like repeat-containing protein n=1 Tax=Tunicatimonas pelagia TaxID=931531 RepID=UPI002666AF77|nr:FG-GAP-like repeat-containing protein [Tunicatimonas pelagia]WKN41077.1 FG-GAP-like repeat-containing protein [Tunicatimonas pelagia]